MKLTYKINLVALGVLISVGAAITITGVRTIHDVTYSLNRQIMAKEIDTIYALCVSSHEILVENQLDSLESYVLQAKSDVVNELADYSYGNTGVLMIVTGDGNVVKHNTISMGNPINIIGIEKMIATHTGMKNVTYDGKDRVFRYKFFPEWNWLLILSVTDEEMFAAKKLFVNRVVVLLVICLLLGSLIFALFIRRVVRPILQLVRAATFVSEGQWQTPLPEPVGKDEVAQLTSAFRNMAKNLEEMYGNLENNLEEIKKSQKALTESEEKYRGLVELLPLAVFETDVHGNLVFANQNMIQSFAIIERDSLNSLHLSQLVAESDTKKLQENINTIMEGERLGAMEYLGQRSDNITFPTLSLAIPLYDESTVSGLRGIFIDITDRKILEEKLIKAQEFLGAILNNVADPIFVKDEEHRWILLNDAFCNFIGLSRDEMIGKSDRDFFPKEEADEFMEKDRLVFATEESNENEEFVTDASGTQHTILTKKAVFKSADGNKILVGTIKDITERKYMEQELLKTQKLKSISILAGGIAHDFNNILTAIIGNLSLLKELVDNESTIYGRLVETEKASFKAKDLTHQLLTFSHGGAPVKAAVSLTKLIEDSVAFTLRGTNVRHELFMDDGIWPIEVDESQMSRVIQNIVVNGLQAMPGGGVLYVMVNNINTEGITTIPLKPGKYICISIKDEGEGIPRELLSSIFDPYYSTKEDGSGLGLSIAYSIIQRHDGHIVVDSDEGVGTTFHIYLPASEKDIKYLQEEDVPIPRGTGTILIMDDEEIILETVGAMLEHLGYTSESAVDGEEALKMYREKLENKIPYDAVIMDLTIPGGMGGQEAIRVLLEMDPEAKALVSSGYSQNPTMANYQDYGFKGVITKPFELTKLATSLSKVVLQPGAVKD